MAPYDYVHRTKTFISGDWTGDNGLINPDRSRCLEVIDGITRGSRMLFVDNRRSI